ncbi:hypothetical protein BSKO_10486 [Bryopsis sp. KO-2023]|nr:hypothetical protein BSKO_10486 [Bryopsis sp. KO-2023]
MGLEFELPEPGERNSVIHTLESGKSNVQSLMEEDLREASDSSQTSRGKYTKLMGRASRRNRMSAARAKTPVLGWYNSLTVKLAVDLPPELLRRQSYEPPQTEGRQRRQGAILPMLDLQKVLKQKEPNNIQVAKSARVSKKESSSKPTPRTYGAWYVPPREWNVIYTARQWAEDRGLGQRGVNNILSQLHERDEAGSFALQEIRQETKKLRSLMTNSYGVRAYKEFTKRRGCRQPNFLQRIATPTEMSNSHKKNENNNGNQPEDPPQLQQMDSLPPVVSAILTRRKEKRDMQVDAFGDGLF